MSAGRASLLISQQFNKLNTFSSKNNKDEELSR